MSRPPMFIGSSSEGLSIARAIQVELENDVDATIWDQGVFGLSQSSLEALENVAHEVEFAVLVLTADDLVTKRGESGMVPRDNVLLEAGVFIGALGRYRVFLVSCREDVLDLPSDLHGITRAEYNRRPGDEQAAVGPVASRIRKAMAEAASQHAPVSRTAEEDGRRRVLALAHEVLTELETDRYQLAEAREREYGWGANDMLQGAKFDKWQKDPDAVVHRDVMDALRGTYIWLHRKNIEMQAREAAELSFVGGILNGPGLMLDATDLAAVDEGMTRIVNAQQHLRRLCDRLALRSTDRSIDPTDSDTEIASRSADEADESLGREAFAAVIKPRLAARTIFGVNGGKPTGEMFLEVHNASEFTAFDVEADIRYRDGNVLKEHCDRIDPGWSTETQWTILLRDVGPASVDVFAEVRRHIESISLAYWDARRLARYRVTVPSADLGEPFDLSAARDRRIT